MRSCVLSSSVFLNVEHLLINLGDINFATATATLEPGAKIYLDKVAKLLRSVPNMSLMIKGHADLLNLFENRINQKSEITLGYNMRIVIKF